MNGKIKNLIFYFLTAFVTLTIMLIISEFFLFFYESKKYLPFRSNQKKVFKVSKINLPGINGDAIFTTDKLGTRSTSNYYKSNLKVLAVGGSTTICTYLDDKETWPAILDSLLDRGGIETWVGNIGKSGHSTREHIVSLNYILKEIKNIDTIILLAGINDLFRYLVHKDYFTIEEILNEQAFYNSAFSKSPLFDNLKNKYNFRNWRTYIFFRNSYNLFKNLFFDEMKISENNLASWREKRSKAQIIYEPMNLEISLKEFRNNLNKIIDLCNQNQSKLIMLTQPSMYSEKYSDYHESLFWAGFTSPDRTHYYSISVLNEMLSKYNDVIKDVASLRSLDLIDLDSVLSKDTTTFYDDCHFNENGASKVAELILPILN